MESSNETENVLNELIQLFNLYSIATGALIQQSSRHRDESCKGLTQGVQLFGYNAPSIV